MGKPALPLSFVLHVDINTRYWSSGQPLMIVAILQWCLLMQRPCLKALIKCNLDDDN